MKKYPIPANEEGRMKKLEYFDLLNLEKDPQLDIFAETACLVTDCPAALIAMMESETQTIQSCVGLALDFVDRKTRYASILLQVEISSLSMIPC